MNQNNYTTPNLNSYFYKFQEAQQNFLQLIKEERLQKRIEKSRKRHQRLND